MKIIIKKTNVDMSPSISQYIEEKIGGLDKFLEKFDQNLIRADVEISRTAHDQRRGDIFRIEVNLSIAGHLIRVDQTEESLMAAIDLAKDELSREIRQYKNKRETKAIRGARSWKKFWRISPLARFRSSKVEDVISHPADENEGE